MSSQELSIEGQKIELRDWRLSDVEPYREWNRPGLDWQSLDGPYYRSEIDESLEIAEGLRRTIGQQDFNSPRMRLAVVDLATHRLIGAVSSYWESKETLWLCAGITLFDPKFWGKGIGFESLGLWCDYLFKHRQEIVRLDMRTWSGNQGLIALAKKLGFKQEACFRKARIVNKEYFDGLGFGILRRVGATQSTGICIENSGRLK